MRASPAAPICAKCAISAPFRNLMAQLQKYQGYAPYSGKRRARARHKLFELSYGGSRWISGLLRAVLKCAQRSKVILMRKMDETSRTLAGCATNSLILQTEDDGTPRARPIAPIRHKPSPTGTGSAWRASPLGSPYSKPQTRRGIGPERHDSPVLWRSYGGTYGAFWRSGGRLPPKYGPKGPFIMADTHPPVAGYGGLYGGLYGANVALGGLP